MLISLGYTVCPRSLACRFIASFSVKIQIHPFLHTRKDIQSKLWLGSGPGFFSEVGCGSGFSRRSDSDLDPRKTRPDSKPCRVNPSLWNEFGYARCQVEKLTNSLDRNSIEFEFLPLWKINTWTNSYQNTSQIGRRHRIKKSLLIRRL